MSNESRPAGGRATAAGMNFQAGVGAWFAAHLATSTSPGERFGLPASALPERLQFETAEYLDDIRMDLSDGSIIFVQCKTRPTLSAAKESPLARTIAQLAQLLLAYRKAGSEADPSKIAAVLAVASDASGSLDDLEAACRQFDLGATWAEVTGRVGAKQSSALEVLAAAAGLAWEGLKAGVPAPEDLQLLARLFHVARFEVEDGGRDRREAGRILGEKLLGEVAGGIGALTTLEQVVNRMTQSGAPADRPGLIQRLRAAGFNDRRSPGYDDDIRRLNDRTANEIGRLGRHARLATSPAAPVPRTCMTALNLAIEGGSLLVIGEPGAGKTGVLVTQAEQLAQSGSPLVMLSVDSLSGISGRDMLRTELRLDHDLLDVLAAWPGIEPGVLIIDALDASRGGPSEQVFANLIEEGLRRLGERWSIIASIRTFDLKNGTRFRAIMAGDPPAPEYGDPELSGVRHFLIPRLSANEIGSLAQSDPQLSRLFASAPPALQQLLHNVFNLSLAADLISGGASAESIAEVKTQSDLIWRYEDSRLTNDRLRNAVGDTLSVMIEKRRIAVLRSRIHNDAISDVVQSGVLALANDRVAFSHHVLFDHAASRFYLEWDDLDALAAQVSADPAIGLLLGPALRFAVEKAWRDDEPGHAQTWQLIAQLCATADIDPVVTSVALRTAAEGVENLRDVAGLIDLLRLDPASPNLATALDRIARFVGMRASEPGGLSMEAATAWAAVAQAGVQNLPSRYSDGARFLLMTLAGKSEFFADALFAARFGEAARDLLAFAWSDVDRQGLADQAIRFVTASFASDPIASKALLEQILGDARFDQHAHEEAPWLAEGITTIAASDPEFAAEIYRTLFSRNILEDGHSWLGGRPSRILALSSNRKQDYEHGRWHLKESFPDFVESSPEWATRAANAVAIGSSRAERMGRSYEPITIDIIDGREIRVIEDLGSLSDWRSERYPEQPAEILAGLADFLRKTDAAGFILIVETAIGEVSATSVWSRIFGVAAERIDITQNLLWPVAISLGFIELLDTGRDAIMFIAAAYPSRTADERAQFERTLQAWLDEAPDTDGVRFSIAARILSTVPDEALVTPEVRTLKSQFVAADRLRGNRPHVSFEMSVGEDRNIVDDLLRNEGADLSQGPDKELRDATRALETAAKDVEGEPDASQIAGLWPLVEEVVHRLDDIGGDAAHAEVQRASWGAVGSAVEKIADAEAYDPAASGHPPLAAIVEIGDRLAASPYPRASTDDTRDDFLAWGNWDNRVYAASVFMDLCRRYGSSDPALIGRVIALASDPVPTVRLQIAQSLNTLWDVAPSEMWSLAEHFGTDEPHSGVLGFLVAGPLRRMSEPEPGRVEAILSTILARLPAPSGDNDRGRDRAEEAISGLTARLWIGRARPAASQWVDGWLSDIVAGSAFLWPLLSTIRMALFEHFIHPGTPEAFAIQSRSKVILDRIVHEAARIIEEVLPELNREDITPDERSRAEAQYRSAARLLDHAMNQIYFGSGTFKRNGRDGEDDVAGLADAASKAAFLGEYSDTLHTIAKVGTARTLHHLLELYSYLADAAPEEVFDRLADLLVGPASREGYHFESLGSDALVRLVRRYLADHREIFDDSGRRARLVAVLELFSGAGWPEALKLLYELPDLLR